MRKLAEVEFKRLNEESRKTSEGRSTSFEEDHSREAKEKKIWLKGATVAENLGEIGRTQMVDVEGDEWNFRKNGLCITYVVGILDKLYPVNDISIEFDGKKVFEGEDNGRQCFVPGAWEQELNALYKRAQRKADRVRLKKTNR